MNKAVVFNLTGGLVSKSNSTIGIKEYELSDHLGNVSVVILDRKYYSDYFFLPAFPSMTDYYPFGYPLPTRSYSSGYRYGFNGQEGDNEIYGDKLNYAFQYRMYDARIGRFWSVDPLKSDYPWNSTYAFAENSPIAFLELEGLEKVIYTFSYDSKTTNWSVTVIHLKTAGELGDGALVKFGNTFFYGSVATDIKEFIKFYEGVTRNEKKQIIGYKGEGEDFVTIGYGHKVESNESGKYKVGTVISDADAKTLFDNDFNERKVNIKGLSSTQNEALSDFSFNTTNEGAKAEKTYNDSKDKGGLFFLRHSAGSKGNKKRRAAEYILFEKGERYKLDHSVKAQKKWEKVYDKQVNDKKNQQ